MKHIIAALLLVSASAVQAVQVVEPVVPVELATNAPERHVVVRGDTLWGISSAFLKDPFRWPEVWRFNKQDIKNPHLLYPGQIVVLDRSGPVPRLKVLDSVSLSGEVTTDKLSPRTYEEAIARAIPSISQQAIEPFLSQPLIMEPDGLDAAPRIVATAEDRVIVGAGDKAYVSGITEQAKTWNVFRPAKPLKDPITDEIIAYEAVFLGTAEVVREGEPATINILTSKQEISLGDRLKPAPPPTLVSYMPHSPTDTVDAQVLAVYGGVKEAGRNAIISINKGSNDGIDIGTVLGVFRAGKDKSYEDQNDGREFSFRMPDERYGLIFVFRVFDRISYALIMNVTRPVIVGDMVRNP